MIKTFEQAFDFVMKEKVCTIFGSKKSPYKSLWDHVDLPERREGESGWGEKVTAVWTWKTALPATFPNEIFYGKVKGGDAVLMEMNHLRDTHYASAKRAVSTLTPLAQKTYKHLQLEPHSTGDLRKLVMEDTGCTKSRFDTALKSLQISMNIVRSNHPKDTKDRWVLFGELYPEIDEESS